MQSPATEDNNIENSNTVADNLFKGYKDDLDYNDEHDIGKYKYCQSFICLP